LPGKEAFRLLFYGGTVQFAKVPGKIPPIIVTNPATASPADTAAGKRPGAAPCGSVIYMSTAMRK
jgi:hypothetical protein